MEVSPKFRWTTGAALLSPQALFNIVWLTVCDKPIADSLSELNLICVEECSPRLDSEKFSEYSLFSILNAIDLALNWLQFIAGGNDKRLDGIDISIFENIESCSNKVQEKIEDLREAKNLAGPVSPSSIVVRIIESLRRLKRVANLEVSKELGASKPETDVELEKSNPAETVECATSEFPQTASTHQMKAGSKEDNLSQKEQVWVEQIRVQLNLAQSFQEILNGFNQFLVDFNNSTETLDDDIQIHSKYPLSSSTIITISTFINYILGKILKHVVGEEESVSLSVPRDFLDNVVFAKTYLIKTMKEISGKDTEYRLYLRTEYWDEAVTTIRTECSSKSTAMKHSMDDYERDAKKLWMTTCLTPKSSHLKKK